MNPYWIDASACRLAILPRPRGYDWLADDIAAARRAGVDVIVSALTESERQELGLSEEAKCCTESAIEFLSFPIEDRSLPDSERTLGAFLDSLDERVEQGKSVAIHCRAGYWALLDVVRMFARPARLFGGVCLSENSNSSRMCGAGYDGAAQLG